MSSPLTRFADRLRDGIRRGEMASLTLVRTRLYLGAGEAAVGAPPQPRPASTHCGQPRSACARRRLLRRSLAPQALTGSQPPHIRHRGGVRAWREVSPNDKYRVSASRASASCPDQRADVVPVALKRSSLKNHTDEDAARPWREGPRGGTVRQRVGPVGETETRSRLDEQAMRSLIESICIAAGGSLDDFTDWPPEAPTTA
jgi:hypothetical protein